LVSLAGWMSLRHLQAIDYLREENRAFSGNNSGIGA
jgi:hypothetical protein